MSNIAKHHSEQKRESDDSKYTRINFFVPGNAISVDNYLENSRKIIQFKMCWRSIFEWTDFLN